MPPGSRTATVDQRATSTKLWSRLREHRRVHSTRSPIVDAEDFTCRYLVVESLRIPLGEAMLISSFKPLWNQNISGFGLRTPGSGRSDTKCSRWDTLHPGREACAEAAAE